VNNSLLSLMTMLPLSCHPGSPQAHALM